MHKAADGIDTKAAKEEKSEGLTGQNAVIIDSLKKAAAMV